MDADKIRKMEAMAREIAEALGRATKRLPDTGFTLFLYSYQGEEFTYISSANREDMVKMMLEFIRRNPPAQTWDEGRG